MLNYFRFPYALHAYGHVDMWTCGHVDMWTCGHVDMWSCGHVDIKIIRQYKKLNKIVDYYM